MLLHEEIKEQLNIDNCLISTYYNRVDVEYYNEDGTHLDIQESISDLINGLNNFAIDVSDMNVTVTHKTRNIMRVEVRPRTDVYLVTWVDNVCISKCHPFNTWQEAWEFADKLPRKHCEDDICIYKNCELFGIKTYWENLRLTQKGFQLIREELAKNPDPCIKKGVRRPLKQQV